MVFAYLLATIVAQGPHDHGAREPAQDSATSGVGCHDPRPGMAGHATPAPQPPPADCAACAFRSNPPHSSASLAIVPPQLVALCAARENADLASRQVLPV